MTELNNKQQEQALELLNNLLSKQTATDYEQDVIKIYAGYNYSFLADDPEERHHLYMVFWNLLDFFAAIQKLPEIDRYTN